MNWQIQNGRLLLWEGDVPVIREGSLLVEKGRILRIGEGGEDPLPGYERIDARDQLIIPGLINMHTHLYMTVLRNYADDLNFSDWLFGRIEPAENAMTAEDAYWSCLLGCMEMIGTGTTCFTDMHMFPGVSARAAEETGLRAFIGRGLVGNDLYGDGKSRLEDHRRERAEFESDRIRFLLSPHAIYTCSETLLRQAAEEARREGILKQIHLSESEREREDCLKQHGKTPVQYLRDVGFLDGSCILAHCVKLTEEDMALLAGSGAGVVTNHASNAKLGNGFAPVWEMAQRGINLCIGTDGAASNNTLNMFREMALLSLIQKGRRGDSTVLPAGQTVKMATKNAARALHLAGQLGEIREGAAADLTFIDLNAPSMLPQNDPLSALCYSAGGGEVRSVMADGRMLMKDREYLTVDRERVLFEVRRIAKSFGKEG